MKKRISLEWLLIRAEWSRFIERASRKVAWLLPKQVVWWAYLRVVGNATSGKWGTPPDELNWRDAIARWEQN